MTTKKKFTLVLGLLSLLFTINLVESTYAKYVTKVSSESDLNVARWDIVVNDKHISEGKEISGTITPKYIDNDDVAEGYIAPGSIGYFDVVIDPSNTDVDFEYEISVKPLEGTKVSDLKLLKYYTQDVDDETVDESNLNNIDLTNNTINDIVRKNNNKPFKLVIFITWYDGAGENMENPDDTKVGYDSIKDDSIYGAVDVSMRFTQKEEN